MRQKNIEFYKPFLVLYCSVETKGLKESFKDVDNVV